MNLTATVEDLNLIARWLARRDGDDPRMGMAVEVVVIPGSEVLATVALAAAVWSTGRARWVMPVGGMGHGTPGLQRAIRSEPSLRWIPVADRAEGAILADVARTWGVPDDAILTEEMSTNCGANATGCRHVLEANGISPRNVLILQDPTMQRRTHASFAQAWANEPDAPKLWSWAVDFPDLVDGREGEPVWASRSSPWPVDRFIGLVLGEVPRLRDDAEGYGPRGRGFIPHVTVPDAVEAAWVRATARWADSAHR